MPHSARFGFRRAESVVEGGAAFETLPLAALHRRGVGSGRQGARSLLQLQIAFSRRMPFCTFLAQELPEMAKGPILNNAHMGCLPADNLGYSLMIEPFAKSQDYDESFFGRQFCQSRADGVLVIATLDFGADVRPLRRQERYGALGDAASGAQITDG